MKKKSRSSHFTPQVTSGLRYCFSIANQFTIRARFSSEIAEAGAHVSFLVGRMVCDFPFSVEADFSAFPRIAWKFQHSFWSNWVYRCSPPRVNGTSLFFFFIWISHGYSQEACQVFVFVLRTMPTYVMGTMTYICKEVYISKCSQNHCNPCMVEAGKDFYTLLADK